VSTFAVDLECGFLFSIPGIRQAVKSGRTRGGRIRRAPQIPLKPTSLPPEPVVRQTRNPPLVDELDPERWDGLS
jgi:hypothetical protein